MFGSVSISSSIWQNACEHEPWGMLCTMLHIGSRHIWLWQRYDVGGHLTRQQKGTST